MIRQKPMDEARDLIDFWISECRKAGHDVVSEDVFNFAVSMLETLSESEREQIRLMIQDKV